MRALALCLFGCLPAFPASAQAPAFNASGVIPSGAKRPTPLSPGMLVSIYGERLGPGEACDGRDEWTSPGVYPPELCGVQVRLDGQTAGLLYVHERQINFEVPSGIASDGTGELLVVHEGRLSPPVAVELGFDSVLLTFAQPAYVDLPIWVDVAAPPRWGGEIRYPFGIDPTVIGCNEIEVLRDGRPLEKIPLAQDDGGGAIASIMCGSLGLRSKPRRIGGLPLHLLYRFDEAGRYELKLTMHNQSMRYPHPGIRLRVTRSKWTAFTVLPSVPGRRAQELAAMRRTAPSDPTELLTDYLPSILGRPDAQSMAMVAEQLYHPESIVRRYAASGLRYWPEEVVQGAVSKLLADRGPSDVVIGWAAQPEPNTARTDAVLTAALAYLRSEDPVLVRGALTAAKEFGLNEQSTASPAARIRAQEALIAAADHAAQVADPQTVSDYAAALGRVKNAGSRALLWSWAERRIALEQTLIALTWAAHPGDLARLTDYLETSATDDENARVVGILPHVLHRSYGAAALPSLERALSRPNHRFVRLECARELMFADRASGWAFALDALEGNRDYESAVARFLRDYFPELGDDEAAQVRELKRRAGVE